MLGRHPPAGRRCNAGSHLRIPQLQFALGQRHALLRRTAPEQLRDVLFRNNAWTGSRIPAASTGGTVGKPGNDGFINIGAFTYSKDVAISTLLGLCSNAAFSEHLDVMATATNGYGTLSGYGATDNAAFALATPCPDCGSPGDS